MDRADQRTGELGIERSVGASGTRFIATMHGQTVGYIEVELRATETGPTGRNGGWADISTLWVDSEHRRQGIGRKLLQRAADWLTLGHIDRLLAYNDDTDLDTAAFLNQTGFTPLTTTTRGWHLPVNAKPTR